MPPAHSWPTKAMAPDSGKVAPILMVVSLNPWPFDATGALIGDDPPAAGTGGLYPPPAPPGLAGADEPPEPEPEPPAAVPPAAALAVAADGPDVAVFFCVGDAGPPEPPAEAEVWFTASPTVVGVPSGVVTGSSGGAGWAEASTGAAA